MYIKEEPLDEEVEVKEEIFASYRTQVKVEIETDSDDSSDEEDSPANIKVEDVKEESEQFPYLIVASIILDFYVHNDLFGQT